MVYVAGALKSVHFGAAHNDPKTLKQEEMCHLQKQKYKTIMQAHDMEKIKPITITGGVLFIFPQQSELHKTEIIILN